MRVTGPVRHLALVLGDQLDPQAGALTSLDPARDALLMLEVAEESTHVASHKQRIALFLSAMRHFAMERVRDGYRVHYVPLDEPRNTQTLGGELKRVIQALNPAALRCTFPGEWRVKREIEAAAQQAEVPLVLWPDGHFLTTTEDFARWMAGRKQPVMEHFYRAQRRALGILMGPSGDPTGGQWNFDRQNRQSFQRRPIAAAPYAPRPDAVTREVLALVEGRFPKNPGLLQSFRWPVTRAQALRGLDDFIQNRLPEFGAYQDAMWAGEPFLYHSLLSSALNLKLLNPRECVAAALGALESGAAPLESVEGFVRQIIGWREFIRGIYWHSGPEYAARNALDQHGRLPAFYWSGRTEMACLRESIGQVLETGYGHHIQRLMVTGNFALIAGVHPRVISDWYLAMYVDAVDWVTLPNTLGMVMHADGGLVGTKPYAASGRYIQRMSNYCASCRYKPGNRTGSDACPFTTFYWDFLIRNRRRFGRNHRMSVIVQQVNRIPADEQAAILSAAQERRAALGVLVETDGG
ncbi:MAG: cryptochrome/photolyase family protein [Planctomycetia bacterium]|nr:MAG: cryptochrome/photolyase family protein [Planctomycetia bacterium]